MKKSFLLTLCLLSVLISCGRREGTESEEKVQEDNVPQETDGFYEAKIIPVNTSIAGSTVGDFRFRILGDEIRVRGDIANSPLTLHRQLIHQGNNCPGPGADEDLDGIVSYDESIRITGGVLVPLQNSMPGSLGNYIYFATYSLTSVLTKLPPDEHLNLAGRTILIYGVNGNSTLPVACGTIERGESLQVQ